MALDSGVDAAVCFLVRSRRGRWWRDFHVAGLSDEWVSGYVGSTLVPLANVAAFSACVTTWHALMRRRRWSGGWGYNRWIPADADSTANVLRFAELLGTSRSIRMRRAYRFLSRHVSAAGGVSTYVSKATLRRVTQMRAEDFGGWCSEHTCVTSLVATLKGFRGQKATLSYLRRNQREDGGWDGYWWYDREYPTAFAVDALLRAEGPSSAPVTRARHWAAARLGPDGFVRTDLEPEGSPFATALCVRVLLGGLPRPDVSATVSRAVEWLLWQQRADGSWRGSAWLRVPPPGLADPEDFDRWEINGRGPSSIGKIGRDQTAIFTTATVISALLPL